jgi:predicted RNA binding protein YcfA (HicA-like mRNA interferase family)
MKPADLLRRLRRAATSRGWQMVETEGGNHTKVVLNGRRTVVGRHRADLKTGTLRGILKQPGLQQSGLEDRA